MSFELLDEVRYIGQCSRMVSYGSPGILLAKRVLGEKVLFEVDFYPEGRLLVAPHEIEPARDPNAHARGSYEANYPHQLPRGIDTRYDSPDFLVEQQETLLRSRKAEGRCMFCGDLLRMSITGLVPCPKCLVL